MRCCVGNWIVGRGSPGARVGEPRKQTEVGTREPGEPQRAAGDSRPTVPLIRTALLIMILIAAASACRGTDRPPTMLTEADTADQIMWNLSHYLTIDGIRRVHVQADTAFFHQGPQVAELRGVEVTFFGSAGERSSTVTSLEGTYHWRSGNMEARYDVVALGDDGRRLTTESLRYERATERIVGDQPFVFVSPERRLEGDGFTSDPDFRNVITTRPRGTVGRVEVDRP